VASLLTVAREEARAVVQDVLVVLLDEGGGYDGYLLRGIDNPLAGDCTGSRA
jgi:hypothetical protein